MAASICIDVYARAAGPYSVYIEDRPDNYTCMSTHLYIHTYICVVSRRNIRICVYLYAGAGGSYPPKH